MKDLAMAIRLHDRWRERGRGKETERAVHGCGHHDAIQRSDKYYRRR
jgi:hypothetical protein